VQQQLVALSVNLQLAAELTGSDPRALRTLLEEMGRDVRHALDETAKLAQRISPPLDVVGLAATLRSAAVAGGVRASVDVDVGASHPGEVIETVYRCWLETLGRARKNTRVAIEVRDQADALTFEIVVDADGSDTALEALRDRVEALGGRLGRASDRGGRTRISASLPVAAPN